MYDLNALLDVICVIQNEDNFMKFLIKTQIDNKNKTLGSESFSGIW